MNLETVQARRADLRNDAVEKTADEFYLAAMLAKRAPKFTPYQVALDAAAMMRASKSIAALAVADCNYGLTKRQETRRESLKAIVEEIAAWYGLTASCHGDPRGAVVRLNGKGVPQTGWGDGFIVA